MPMGIGPGLSVTRFESGIPGWMTGMDLGWDFTQNVQYSGATNPTDTHSATVYAQSAAGVWSPFAANTLVRTDLGLQTVPTRTNLFLNSLAPVTQTITVAAATQYNVAVFGSGSATLSGAGTGTATVGSPVTFTASTTSLTVTVSGSPFCVNVTTGAFATPPIVTTGTSATVNGNQQVVDLTGMLGSGVGGILQINLLNAVNNDRILTFSDGTTNNSCHLLISGGNLFIEMFAAGAFQGHNNNLGAFSGVETVAFSFGPNYINGLVIGNTGLTADTTATYPSMSRINFASAGGGGFQPYQLTRRAALRFGAQNASTFADLVAKATLLAAVS